MNKFLKFYVRKKYLIIIATQDKFTKFHQGLIFFCFCACHKIVCLQTLPLRWLPYQHLAFTMALKLFRLYMLD